MDNYDDQTARIKELANTPQVLESHLANSTDALNQAAPNITQGLHTAIATGVNFLNSKIPQADDQLPLSKDYEPPQSQMNKFSRYFDAVNDPIGALKHVKEGTLSPEHMEALNAVHPALLQEMKTKVLSGMDPQKSKDLPYGRRLALSLFLGQPLEEASKPSSILSNQISFAGPNSNEQTAGPAPQKGRKTAVAGFKDVKASSRAATQTQQDIEDK